jgi:flagellar operon protein
MADTTINPILFPTPLQAPQRPTAKQSPQGNTGAASPFAKILDAKSSPQPLAFSRHAQERLQARGIKLSEQDLTQLAGAVDTVAQKGGKDSLVMLGDAAFVVSVANRTVVTAMDRASMQGNVFTNIDSAVVA